MTLDDQEEETIAELVVVGGLGWHLCRLCGPAGMRFGSAQMHSAPTRYQIYRCLICNPLTRRKRCIASRVCRETPPRSDPSAQPTCKIPLNQHITSLKGWHANVLSGCQVVSSASLPPLPVVSSAGRQPDSRKNDPSKPPDQSQNRKTPRKYLGRFAMHDTRAEGSLTVGLREADSRSPRYGASCHAGVDAGWCSPGGVSIPGTRTLGQSILCICDI